MKNKKLNLRANLRAMLSLCILGSLPIASLADEPVKECVDAGYRGEGLLLCSSYSILGCIPGMDDACGDIRSRFFEVTGDVVMPSDCGAPSLMQKFHQQLLDPPPPPPPAPEPMSVENVPLPEHITAIGVSLDWSESGDELYFTFESDNYSGRHSGAIKPDGSDFRCLTCNLGDLDVAGMRRLDDQRMFVGGPGVPAPRTVLECLPSLDDCQTSQLVPIEIPGANDPRVVIAEGTTFTPAPDGEHVFWNQIWGVGSTSLMLLGKLERQTAPDRYEIINTKIIGSGEYEGTADDLTVMTGSVGEPKFFARGGAAVKYLSLSSAFNFDHMIMDLETGEFKPLTQHSDYDDTLDFSPDEQWFVTGGSRTHDISTPLSQVIRPPAVLAGNITSRHAFYQDNFSKWGHWLVDKHGARDGYIGQKLPVGDEGRRARFARWSPDGTKIALTEQALTLTPIDGMGPRDIRIVSLTSRQPSANSVEIVPTPDPVWAQSYDQYVPNGDTVEGIIKGKVFGTAEIVSTVNGFDENVQVTYTNYSDDGIHVLNGTESEAQSYGVWPPGGPYTASIEVSGCQEGHQQSYLYLGLPIPSYGVPLSITGNSSSEWDGNLLEYNN